MQITFLEKTTNPHFSIYPKSWVLENQIFYNHGLDRVAKQDFSLLHNFHDLWRSGSVYITYPNNT